MKKHITTGILQLTRLTLLRYYKYEAAYTLQVFQEKNKKVELDKTYLSSPVNQFVYSKLNHRGNEGRSCI